jgi:DNA-binding NtrC family response regulator
MARNLGPTRAMTVRPLVVDDEPDVEPLFRQQFRREVREGTYMLEIILLVSDITLQGMSGLDLIPEVKVRRPDLPVFMISTHGGAAAALARGADGFLSKPIDFPKLKQDIMAVMTDATGDNG